MGGDEGATFTPCDGWVPDALTEQLNGHDRQLSVHDIRMAEMDLRFQLLETASYDGKLIWKIRDYARRKLDAANGRTLSLYSQPFYTNRFGYKMCARVYINGDGMGKGSHLSLFFVIMRGEYDALLVWPFRQKVTMTLLDQSAEKRHLTDSFQPDPGSSSFQKPVTEMNVASGCPLFVSHSILENQGNSYLKDDAIFIRIVVDDTAGASPF
ncbi:TNF receptor-associated factor 3 [Nucella lapillus]